MISLVNRHNSVVHLQGSSSGGPVDLENGIANSQGFLIAISPGGAEGLLKVTLLDAETPCFLPFFKGYGNNPLIREIHPDQGNTATGVYWYR